MILILGGQGYVASAFREILHRMDRPHQVLSRAEFDYTNRSRLRQILDELKPEFLINAAGFTGKPNVDACETQQADCLFANAVFPSYVREVCEDLKLPWGQISSGCIYDGQKQDGSGFSEQDEPNFSFRTNFCSFYSGSKALGEEMLIGADRCFIWRLRIPFNQHSHPRNYLQKLLSYKELLDATNSISHLEESVSAALACFDQGVPYGIYNVTNPGVITTKQIVGWMEEESERRKQKGERNPFDRPFQFFSSQADFMSRAAMAPRSNCVLDSSKLLSTGIELRPVEIAVKDALKHWQMSSECVEVR